MAVSLEDRLKALDYAREKIIHESFIELQKELDAEMKKSQDKLKKTIGGKES